MQFDEEISRVSAELQQLKTERNELNSSGSADQCEQADVNSQLMLNVAKTNMKNAQLSRLVAAKRRFLQNEYGYCLTCFDDIEPQRLLSDIATERCACCESAAASGKHRQAA